MICMCMEEPVDLYSCLYMYMYEGFVNYIGLDRQASPAPWEKRNMGGKQDGSETDDRVVA